MPTTIILNECAPARGKSQGARYFVQTTATPSHERDSINDLYHTPRARRKP